MNTLLRPLVGLLCVVVLGGCGASDSTSGGSAATTPATASDTSTSATHGRPAIMSVTYRRSGGLKPSAVTRVFTAGETPPRGFTTSEVDRVLAAARRFVDSDEIISPLPADTCCDRYTYTVTITWSDGTSKTFSAIDGVQQPPAFDSLLSRLA